MSTVTRENHLGWRSRDGDGGIPDMCAYGAQQVRDGKYDSIEFKLTNLDEAKRVRRIMKAQYPGVPYSRKWFGGGTDTGDDETDLFAA